MKRISLILLLLLCAALSSSMSNAPEKETKDWNTYTNNKYNFEIKYPKDWIVKEAKISDRLLRNNTVVFLGFAEGSGPDTLYNLKLSNLRLIKELEKQILLASNNPNSEVVDIANIRVNDTVGKKIKIQNKTNGLVSECIMLEHDHQTYVFFFPDGDKIGKQILQSLRFKAEE
ncbi:MAG: hypothetical protein HQ596_00810 [Candidatus Saganbacteria bacterium]|nr:hypothetical protein [Candidatus Saganbacteria bacterium]